MAHTIYAGPHPDIMIMDLEKELTYEDMTADAALGLNEGRTVYVFLDASKIHAGVPEGFLDGARKSYFVNPNLGHLAVYLKSDLLRAVATMVAKLTKRKDRLSLHDSREAALAHLQQMVAQAQATRG